MRAERINTPKTLEQIGTIERPIPVYERLYNMGWLRKLFVLLILAGAWQWYGVHLDDNLLFPTLFESVSSWWNGVVQGDLLAKAGNSLAVLLQGYVLGALLAFVFVAFASSSRLGSDALETLSSMCNALPAVAVVPIAMLWFGLSNAALVFTLVFSVIWTIALNTHAGFSHVSEDLRRVGKNYGLGPIAYATKILFPAALPSIITGLKIGWSFGWRTLVAAEFVFGVSSGAGGLGFHIFESKNNLDIAGVFAGLLAVIIIGLFMDYVVFRFVENKTVRAWGMKHD